MESQTSDLGENKNFDNYKYDLKTKVFHPRLAWMIYYQQVHNIKKVCDKFGISRKTFYKWWLRYYKSGYQPESLFDRSKKPIKSPSATPMEIIQKILNVKETTGYGPRKLRNYLLENLNIKISEHTIWKLLKKYHTKNHNLYDSDGVPIHSSLPGDEVYITVYSFNLRINNSKIFIISAVDLSTRLRISKIFTEFNITGFSKFLNFAKNTFPFKINKIKFTEHKLSEVVYEFQDLTQQFQISFSNKYERDLIESEIHEYDKKNFWDQVEYDSVEKLENNFNDYVRMQNNHTSRKVLGGLTPLQKLRKISHYQKILYFDY